jgi:hypothetical protein
MRGFVAAKGDRANVRVPISVQGSVAPRVARRMWIHFWPIAAAYFGPPCRVVV